LAFCFRESYLNNTYMFIYNTAAVYINIGFFRFHSYNFVNEGLGDYLWANNI